MEDGSKDPEALAARVWADTLSVLNVDSSLTAREKSWLAGVTPEAVYGPTIVLRVDNAATQQALQGELNETLIRALQLASGNKPIFPAFKLVSRVEVPIDEEHVEVFEVPAAEHANTDSESATATSGAAAPATETFEELVSPSIVDVAQEAPVAPSAPATDMTAHTPLVAPVATPAPAPVAAAAPAPAQTARQARTQHAPTAAQGQLPIPADMPAMPLHGGSRMTQLDPETHLNMNATFETFVPGDSNRFARTVALAVAEGSGRDFNPLCIYGGSGLGKTHLLNAIGNYALVKDPTQKVRYVTSEEFTNEFIETLQDPNKNQGQIAEFNRRYREVDVLLIDDIQFLGGKEATLDQFFHTFNALHQANKRIVIASDVAPQKLQGFEKRLISRFESGLTVDVKPPDLETRIAILRMMASVNGSKIPNDVFYLIAERFTENIRELEGALTRVTAVASLDNQPVTRVLAERTLQDFFSSDVEIRPADIIAQVARYFHLTFDDIVGRSRTKNVALARQVAMYLAREMTSMSLVDIGQVFGGRDHTTVMHACDRITNEMSERQEIYDYVTELTMRLKQHQND